MQQVNDQFGQPGDFVANGKGHVYTINGIHQEPFKGHSALKDKHDNLNAGALYGPGRFLVQNKGLVLGATNSPLPGNVKGANETEKTIILAIAMQESQFMDTRDLGYPTLKTGKAENKSCLNVNVDMLDRADQNWRMVIDDAKRHGGWEAEIELKVTVGCLLRWFRGQVSDQQGRQRHLNDTLNFLRGGSDSFESNGAIHRSHLEVNTNDYLNAIASIYRELRWNTSGYDDEMGSNSPNSTVGGAPWNSHNLYANNVRIDIDIPGI